MKYTLLTFAVTILILSVSAALNFLRYPLDHAFEWILVLSCALSSMIALIVMVGVLLKDLTQTDSSNRRRRSQQFRSRGVNYRAQATQVGNREPEKISPLGRNCLRRDRGFERNAMDNRVPATYETQQHPPTNTFVPGRKPLSDWHRSRTRDDRQDGFSNINQRRQ